MTLEWWVWYVGTTMMINIRGIADDVHRQFKTKCASQGITMREALMILIEGVVAGELTFTDPPDGFSAELAKDERRRKAVIG